MIKIIVVLLVLFVESDMLSAQTSTISGVVNSYFKVRDVSDNGSKIYVDNATGLAAGDWLLLIQHQGAAPVPPDECDGPTGNIAGYDAAGNFEMVRIKAIDLSPSGPLSSFDAVELEAPMTMFYYACGTPACPHDAPFPGGNDYGFQAVKVYYYDGTIRVNGTVTADPWDGEKGGVVVLASTDMVLLQANIDVSGKGFRGGAPSANNTNVDRFEYFYDPVDNYAGSKGEGITDVHAGSNAGRAEYEESAGRGALANGGGGGNGKNAGGGGGSNYGAGGHGGKQNSAEDDPGTTADDDEQFIGGEGGWELVQYDLLPYAEKKRTQIFFGGGGGGGHRSNDNTSTSGDSKGGAGGGIVIILAKQIKISGGAYSILANGAVGASADNGNNGAGGGGGGGTILLDVGQFLTSPSNLTLEAKGGAGGSTDGGSVETGPGGGGGGGVIWFRTAAGVSSATSHINGGGAGLSVPSIGPFGATAGEDGKVLDDLKFPKWYGPGEPPI